MDTNTILVFVLAILGIVILAAEVVLPSFGMLPLMAIICFVSSGVFAWNAWYATGQTGIWWTYIAGMVVAVPGTLIGAFYWLPKTALGQRMLAMPPSADEVRPFVEEEHRLRALIDHEGETLNLFSPGGMIKIGHDKFHAESEGILIDPHTAVVVVGLKGNRLVVRPRSMMPASWQPASAHDAPHANEPARSEKPDGTAAVPDEATRTAPGNSSRDTFSSSSSRSSRTPREHDAAATAPAEPEAIDFDVPDET